MHFILELKSYNVAYKPFGGLPLQFILICAHAHTCAHKKQKQKNKTIIHNPACSHSLAHACTRILPP